MLRPFKSLQHTEVTSSHLILVLLFQFILFSYSDPVVSSIFVEYKIFWIVLFIFLIKCCIFIGYEFTYLQNWLTKSIENWLTSKNITLLRSNVNLLSFVVQVQGQDCAVRHEDTYWCPWSSNAVPFLLPMSHTITDSS